MTKTPGGTHTGNEDDAAPHRHQPKVPLDFYRYINIFAAVRPRRIHHRLGLKENAVPSGARHPAHLTQPSHQHRVLQAARDIVVVGYLTQTEQHMQ